MEEKYLNREHYLFCLLLLVKESRPADMKIEGASRVGLKARSRKD